MIVRRYYFDLQRSDAASLLLDDEATLHKSLRSSFGLKKETGAFSSMSERCVPSPSAVRGAYEQIPCHVTRSFQWKLPGFNF
jgi:hypothetical protein